VKRSVLGVLLVLAFVAVGIAAAPPLTFTFSDVHANKSATETDSYGVGNSGAITGDYLDKNGVQHGMVLLGKKLTTFDYSKCSSNIAAYGINTANMVAGWCIDTNGIDIGFTWDGKKFTDINFPKGTGTQPTGINDNGDIVGLYFDANGAQHAFSKIGKTYKSIDVKGESSAAAWGINNAGHITVYAVNSGGGFDAFLYNGKKSFKNINEPNAGPTGTVVHTPNNKGDIDGTYYDASGNTHGWLFHLGKYYDVNDPNGSNLSRADGLNDKDVIVGRYTPSAGGNVGFKAITKK
jgi:hypothetical protein